MEEYSIINECERFKYELTNEDSEDYDVNAVFELELVDRMYEGLTIFRGVKELLENNDGGEERLKKVEKVIESIEELML